MVNTGTWSWTICCSMLTDMWKLPTLDFARKGWASVIEHQPSVVRQSSLHLRFWRSRRTHEQWTGGDLACSSLRCLLARYVHCQLHLSTFRGVSCSDSTQVHVRGTELLLTWGYYFFILLVHLPCYLTVHMEQFVVIHPYWCNPGYLSPRAKDLYRSCFVSLLESPGFFLVKFSGPGKS